MKYISVFVVFLINCLVLGPENQFCRYWEHQTSNMSRYAAACMNGYALYPGKVSNPSCNHFKTMGHPNIFMTQHAWYCPPKQKPYSRKNEHGEKIILLNQPIRVGNPLKASSNGIAVIFV